MNQEDFHLIQALTNLSEVVDRERSITPDCLDYRKLVETPHSILSSSSHASSSFQTFPSGPFPSPSVTSVPPSPSSFSVGTPYSLHSIPYAEETLSSPPSSFLPIPSAPFSAQQQARRRSTRRNKRKISLGEQEIQEFGLAMEGLGDDEQKSKKQRVAELPPVVYYTLDSLRPYFHKKLPDAASILGLSPTKLKQISRDAGIPKWPFREIKVLRKRLQRIEAKLNRNEGEADLTAKKALISDALTRINETGLTDAYALIKDELEIVPRKK